MSMNLFITVKARIEEDYLGTRKKVEEYADYLGNEHIEVFHFSKRPVDYENVLSPDKFTVTWKNEKYLVNFRKEIERSEGIGRAVEKQFEITDFEDFKELMENFDIGIYVKEIRNSNIFKDKHDENIIIKLTNVEELGQFIEIESECETENDTKFVRQKVQKILRDLGIEEKDREDRFYFELLLEKEKGAE